MTPASVSPHYEPHESPPALVAAGVGLQFTVVASIETLVGPVIVVKGSGGSDAFLLWLVFATLVVIGVSTLLQVVRLGPIGTGAVFPVYTSFAAIPFCIMALVDGGPTTMTTLVLVSAAFQIIFSRWLFNIRRIITPTVYGTVMMLIALSLASVALGLRDEAPVSSPWSAPVAALATLAIIVGITLRGSDTLRLWAPLCGIAVGCAAAAAMGIYDLGIVAQASWVGIPLDAWPLVNGLHYGASFWSLVPAFLFLSVIISLQTGGTFISLHQSSWRQARAVDFREVQRSISTTGAGNLIAGLAGAPPNIGALTMVSFVQITGVASRKVGYWVAGAFISLAFLPKASSLFASIPSPVMTGFIITVAAVMFSEGARTVVQDGLDRRKVVIVGVSVLIGAAFEFRLFSLPELHPVYESLLRSGMTAGGLTGIFLNLFMELTAPRRMRFRSTLDVEALPDLNEFISKFTERQGWGSEMTDRVSAAAEETLLTLAPLGREEDDQDKWRLLVLASSDGPVAVLEFIGAASAENLEDRIRHLQEQAVEAPSWPEFSIRLLTHYSSSVRHQRYHDADVITIRIDPPGRYEQSQGAS